MLYRKFVAPGCGFPIAKIGALFSLATGAAVALVIDVLNTHDVKLARRLYQFLKERRYTFRRPSMSGFLRCIGVDLFSMRYGQRFQQSWKQKLDNLILDGVAEQVAQLLGKVTTPYFKEQMAFRYSYATFTPISRPTL